MLNPDMVDLSAFQLQESYPYPPKKKLVWVPSVLFIVGLVTIAVGSIIFIRSKTNTKGDEYVRNI